MTALSIGPWRYNVRVPTGDETSGQDTGAPERRKRRAYALETTGLLIIAALAFIVVLVRYWHVIPWRAR